MGVTCWCVLEEDQTSNVTVHSFNGTNYMSVAENSLIKKTEDIGKVVDEATSDTQEEARGMKAEIVAVQKL